MNFCCCVDLTASESVTDEASLHRRCKILGQALEAAGKAKRVLLQYLKLLPGSFQEKLALLVTRCRMKFRRLALEFPRRLRCLWVTRDVDLQFLCRQKLHQTVGCCQRWLADVLEAWQAPENIEHLVVDIPTFLAIIWFHFQVESFESLTLSSDEQRAQKDKRRAEKSVEIIVWIWKWNYGSLPILLGWRRDNRKDSSSPSSHHLHLHILQPQIKVSNAKCREA